MKQMIIIEKKNKNKINNHSKKKNVLTFSFCINKRNFYIPCLNNNLKNNGNT